MSAGVRPPRSRTLPYRFEVLRDDLGIPHVHADDELALAAGQGWVTARDRGWQIEVDRWRAEGRLAERVGPAGLDWDRFAHRVRLADTARRAFAALDQDDRGWVEAYVEGVNAGLGTGRDVPEMHALADLPGSLPPHEPWPSWMPLAILHVAHVLFSGFGHVLWRDHVARTLGAAHPDRPLAAVVDVLAGDGGPTAGSNAWALHGSRTASGLPLLAGDPHRLLELPGVYQQVRLVCDDYDVLGLAFPGVPGVPHFGHAGEAAWGITNAVAHHVEVVRERLRPAADGVTGGVEALGPDGWAAATSGRATVRVRGRDDVDVPWVETARGVVVTGLDDLTGHDLTGHRPPGNGPTGHGPTGNGPTGHDPTGHREDDAVTYGIRIPARVTADLGLAAARALLRVRSADDVAAAFTRWVDPVNRVLAGDRTGRVIGFTAGRVPLREPEDRRLPLNAWSTAARPAPWRTLPPPVEITDLAVDANERPDRPAVALGHEYAAPHRARRVRALLLDVEDARPEDQEAVHRDTLLGGVDVLLDRLDPLPPTASEHLRTAVARLQAWDRRMGADSVDAALFAAWRHAVVRRLVAHPALAPLTAPHGLGPVLDPWLVVPVRVAAALPALLDATWLGIDGRAEAVAALEEVVAVGPPARTWGATHRLRPLHLLGDVPGAVVPALLDTPLPGDTDCVQACASAPGVTDGCVLGPVARWVWDLADRDASRWGVPFGAAGDPRSPHATDQHASWVRGETSRVVTDRARLRREEVR